MNEQQNSQCARCGYTAKEPMVVPQYSDMACHFLRTDDSEPVRSLDNFESDEAAFLREELKRGRDMLASVDDDIATLQAMLVDLKAKRDSLQKFVDDHAVILSRVCLPSELWAKIFHLVQPVVNTDVKGGIWPLGRVCSYWRGVLLSSPSLWSTIYLDWGQSVIPVTEEILSRSGNLPLRISLEYVSGSGKTDEQMSVLLGTIIAASYRWYAVTLYVPEPQCPLLNRLKGRIPMLTEVSYGTIQPFTKYRWLERAPSLRKLNINLGPVPSPSVLALPWSQLLALECDVYTSTLNQEYHILRQCVNLETYTLQVQAGRDLETDPVPSNSDLLCMSKLHTLTVNSIDNDANDGAASIDILTAPSLDEVAIKYTRPLTKRFLSSFSNLLSRSYCFPTKLKIGVFPKDTAAAPLFSLVSLQNLTTLDVNCYMQDLRLVVSALTLRPETENSAILLPRLEKLHLRPIFKDTSDTARCGMTSMIDMVQSRWHLHECVEVASHLAFFGFSSADYVSSWHVPRPRLLRGTLTPLLAFRDEGLEMDIDEWYLKKDIRYLLMPGV